MADSAASLTRLAEIRAGKAGRDRGDLFEIDRGRGLHLLDMHLQDRDPRLLVGPVERNLPVEAACARERRVENFGAVRRGKQHDSFARVETVEFRQQLVQRLLLLIVAPAGETRCSRAAETVKLVDKNDTGLHFARLLEKVANASRADADEHFHELRPGNREERHARLARDRAREQRFADAGRADEQDALRHARAEPPIGFGVFQEVDDLFQFVLRFVRARHVVERDARHLLNVDLRTAPPDAHEAAKALLVGNPADEEGPNSEENEDRKHPGEDIAKQALVLRCR